MASIFTLLIGLSAALPANAGPLEDSIAPMRSAFEQAWNSKNLDKLVGFYTKNALYFNVNLPELVIGSDSLRSMFARAKGAKIKLGDHTVIQVAPNVLLSSGYFEVTVADGKTYPFRLTWALVKVDGDWKIAQSHTSNFPNK